MKFPMSKAERRYVLRLAASMGAYIVALLLTRAWLESEAPPTGALLYLAAVVPALPILASIAVLGRYIAEETDEYLRSVLVRSVLWSTGLTLAVTTVWGFLQAFAHVAAEPVYITFVVFWLSMALVQAVIKLMERV